MLYIYIVHTNTHARTHIHMHNTQAHAVPSFLPEYVNKNMWSFVCAKA